MGGRDRILVVNAGSSTIKLSLIGTDDETLGAEELQAPQSTIDTDAVADALAGRLAGVDAVGHRIVHGGDRFRQPVRIDAQVEAVLRELVDLAPLHQPKSLAALDAVSRALPDVPAVACFDTAFHATMPPAARTYAIPRDWRERWHVQRYGFHGLSHAWAARRAPSLLGVAPERLRIVSCHLGAGASLCAIAGGRSVETTMGFTPLEGLVMATRSGSVDPGLVLWLLEHARIGERELGARLEHDSGLLALAGSADMRAVLKRARSGDGDAQLALDVYLHRLRAGIAAMATAMSGLDAVVFTGGVGERSPEVRARAASGLEFLGLAVDEQRNLEASPDCDVSATDAEVRALVVRSREELEIARQVRAVLG